MDFVLLIISFAVVLAGALLFTNAIEWIGHRLGLGEGAVGSILAAVGTATPETLIAIVALLGAAEGSEDVAIGAIVGAPFLLATLAMGLVGLFAFLYRGRRSQGIRLDAHGPTLERDLPSSFSSPSSVPPASSPGGRRPGCGSRSGSDSSPPTCSTWRGRCGPGGRRRGRRRSIR
jgi:Ca2+/Na+ antiporter